MKLCKQISLPYMLGGIFLMLVGLSACVGTEFYSTAYSTAKIYQSVKPLKKEFQQAVTRLTEVQNDKHVFNESQWSELLEAQSTIETVLERLESWQLTEFEVSIEDVRLLWNMTAGAYDKARNVIVEVWDKLPASVKADLAVFDSRATRASVEFNQLMQSNTVQTVDKAVTVIGQVVSLVIKLMGVL